LGYKNKDYIPASHLIPANVPDRLQKQTGYKNGYKNIYTLRERESKRERGTDRGTPVTKTIWLQKKCPPPKGYKNRWGLGGLVEWVTKTSFA